MLHSKVVALNSIELPLINDEISMVPFQLSDLSGLFCWQKHIAREMLAKLPNLTGIAYLTIHGVKLKCNQTHRRGGPHIDGNYDRTILGWGDGGWKVGENGPAIDTPEHRKLYCNPNGGIIIASNYTSSKGWVGDFEGIPNVGGDCSHIPLNKSFPLIANTVYYGNNHFIHESLPVNDDVHRVMARITLPITHNYRGDHVSEH